MACTSVYWIKPKGYLNWIPVPCGKCYNCRNRKVDEWVYRLMTEEKHSTSSYYITLTYDSDNVPINEQGQLTLNKKHVQRFIRNLRKKQRKNPNTIKYYCRGEYGGFKERPHYHLIMFNIDKAQNIIDTWTKGHVYFGNVVNNTIAYTTAYLDKEGIIPKFAGDMRSKEFYLMSKGLGNQYLNETNRKYHSEDITRNYITKEGNHKIALPRYYRDKLYTKEQRKAQKKIIKKITGDKEQQLFKKWERLYKCTMTFDQYIHSINENFHNKQKSKKRKNYE